MNTKKQLLVLAALLAVYAVLIFFSYLLLPLDQIAPVQGAPSPMASMPGWQLGLLNAAIFTVLYGLLGLAGFWFAHKLGLPGVFREGAGWKNLFTLPLLIGLATGLIIIIGDRIFALLGQFPGFPHPEFPLSIIASFTAAIGEELLFRMFVMGLWAFLLNLVLKRWGKTGLALWIGNLIGALAFGAGHIPAAMLLMNSTTPAEVPALVWAEIFLLNGILGLLAGQRYMKDGYVAAVGVHFWADILWHVAWPLLQ